MMVMVYTVCTLLLCITSLATYMSCTHSLPYDYLPNVAMSKHLTNNKKYYESVEAHVCS